MRIVYLIFLSIYSFMKKILVFILGFGFLLTSCGENNKSTPVNPDEESVISWYAGVGQFNGNLDFGNLNSSAVKLSTLSVKNVGDRTLTGPVIISGQGFTLAYSNCGSVLVGKTCTLKVSFNPQGLANQIYSGSIMLDGSQADLSAAINITIPVQELQASIGDIPISEAGVDFGIVKYNQNILKTLSITNAGRNKGPYVVAHSGSDFVVSYDSCSNRELSLNFSCVIKISLSGAGKSGPVMGGLTIGNLNIPLTATVKNLAQISAEQSDIKLVVNNIAQSAGPVDLGTWNIGQTQNLNFYLKNVGTETGILQSVQLDSLMQSVFNSCENGAKLSPNDKCLIKLTTVSQSKGLFSSNVVVQGNTYNIQATVRAPGDKIYCSMNYSDNAFITWSGSSYSQCVAESCLPGFHLNGGQCEADCQPGSDVIYGTQNWQSPSGCNTIVVEVYGGGGGGSYHSPGLGGVGGGGGGYTRSSLATTPGTIYYVVVGGGGSAGTTPGATGGAGTYSSFNNNSIIAYGGNGGSHAAGWTVGGGAGGGNQANYTGGYGGMWLAFQCGGGGGGAAGPNGNGAWGAYATCARSGSSGGGLGGVGGHGYGSGYGANFGGGGGGGYFQSAGGAGAQGIVKITYSFTP